MTAAVGDLVPGRSTAPECLDALAVAASTAEAHEATLAFLRAPVVHGWTHLLRPARRAWEESFAAAWAAEAALPAQGTDPDGPPPHLPGQAAWSRAAAWPSLEEVAVRGRAGGRRLAPGRRAR